MAGLELKTGWGTEALGGTWAPHRCYVDIRHRAEHCEMTDRLRGQSRQQAADVDQGISQNRPARCAILHEAHSGAAVNRSCGLADSTHARPKCMGK